MTHMIGSVGSAASICSDLSMLNSMFDNVFEILRLCQPIET
jgi:hypothetical protein